ncbi:MAG: hypothetical protein JW867_00435, partial [Candidatus Omnitrophica bacterium]|nr:hypothetical protein [Candidatus Omnitrophota bacterium]
PILKAAWIKRETFKNWIYLIIIVGLLFVGAYWTFAVYGLSSSGSSYGVYQRGLEEWYGVSDLNKYYSFSRLFGHGPEILRDTTRNVLGLFFQPYSAKIFNLNVLNYYPMMPGYISLLAFMGLIIFTLRFRHKIQTWLLILGLSAALYMTTFISLPNYLRPYFWVIPFILLFATLAINEIYRLIPLAERIKINIQGLLGFALICYFFSAGLVYLTGIRKVIIDKWHFSPTPGLNLFFDSMSTFKMFRGHLNVVAKGVREVKPAGTKTLHLLAEPGVDLSAFMEENWWDNYLLYFHGNAEQMFRERNWRENDCAYALLENRISVIHVPLSWEIINAKAWSEDGRRALKMIQGWIEDFPQVFKEIQIAGRIKPWHRVYLVQNDLLRETFQYPDERH